ncbi:class E sortase [Streptomyces sp. NBC_00503]|uniref:class E sortase n=1 Tax=Streptomyces sp. NBC_00503 TaxID=2903659 RepID=UPI002E8020E5|nr:class E sortase [Streptomyces sp. NBC_00503]WUD81502.1 class E sortase [Streptomyces sp. NBC_00503]
MRDRVRVVVQGKGRRTWHARRVGLAGVLWAAGELAVTVGVVVLLLVVHQVWWTNRQALTAAHERVAELEGEWGAPGASSGSTGATDDDPVSDDPAADEDSAVQGGGDGGDGTSRAPRSGSGPGSGSAAKPPPQEGAYGVLRIPRLGVVVPVAQGVDKRSVLDKGYAGHYVGTAQPGAEGNFALAGHRNTHGEPFRYINRLKAGDELIVDVKGRRYVYVVGKTLGQTTEHDTGVIAPVPRSTVDPEAGYSEPGAYITLTTCTPEYTSKYRLVVWGTLKR